MRYSYSRIECFRRCPLEFKYRYIDKIEVEAYESIEAFMGCRVHETLDVLYKTQKAGRLLPLKELLNVYQNIWKDYLHEDIAVSREDMTAEDYYTLGGDCIQDYYKRYMPFTQAQTIATEMQLNFDLLGDGQYKFIGFIDRLDRREDGCYEIHDYKTGRKLPTQDSRDKDQQLALYELGIRQKHKAEEVELVWHYLTHGKELRSNRTQEQLQKLKQDLLETIYAIERSIVDDRYPTQKTGLCNWCEYQEICITNNKKRNKQMKIQTYTK